MKPYFRTPITCKEEAEKFFDNLNADDLLFHPEDDPCDIIKLVETNPNKYEPLFTLREARYLRDRLDEAWLHLADPCEYILENFIYNE